MNLEKFLGDSGRIKDAEQIAAALGRLGQEQAMRKFCIVQGIDALMAIETNLPYSEYLEKRAQSGKDSPREKLLKEVFDGKRKSFLEPIGKYLFSQRNPELLAQVHCKQRNLESCISYIYDQAKKMADGDGGMCLAVREDVVYQWAEEYYFSEIKSVQSSSSVKTDEKRTDKKKVVRKRKTIRKQTTGKTADEKENKKETTALKPRTERTKRDEVQISLFDICQM